MLSHMIKKSKRAAPVQETSYGFSDETVNVHEVVANTNILV